jgi:hypothetical protein
METEENGEEFGASACIILIDWTPLYGSISPEAFVEILNQRL